MISSHKSQVTSHFRGQTLFELVVALGIGILIVTAIVSLVSSSVRNSRLSKSDAIITRYSDEAMEWVRSQKDQGWSNISGTHSSIAGTTWCLNSLSWPNTSGACSTGAYISGTAYQREIKLTQKDLEGDMVYETVEVQIKMIWTDGPSNHNSTVETRFTNWKQK